MSFVNTRGPQGTADALRRSNPAVLRNLVGPDGTQDVTPAGPGAELDARLDDLAARVGQLEAGEPGEDGAA